MNIVNDPSGCDISGFVSCNPSYCYFNSDFRKYGKPTTLALFDVKPKFYFMITNTNNSEVVQIELNDEPMKFNVKMKPQTISVFIRREFDANCVDSGRMNLAIPDLESIGLYIRYGVEFGSDGKVNGIQEYFIVKQWKK